MSSTLFFFGVWVIDDDGSLSGILGSEGSGVI